MKVFIYHDVKFRLYEYIDELPIKHWNMLNEYSILSAGIGSMVGDVLNHVDRIALFVAKDKRDAALRQRQNMHQCIWNCLRGLNYHYLQAAALHADFLQTESQAYEHVGFDLDKATMKASEKINDAVGLMKSFDKGLKTWNEDFLLRAVDPLRTAFHDFLTTHSERSKKADSFNNQVSASLRDPFLKQLEVTFPGHFGKSSKLNYFTQVKNKVIHELKYVIHNDPVDKESSDRIEDYFVSLMIPDNFDGSDHNNLIVQQKLAFENLCVAMMSRGLTNPSELSVMRFYSSVDYFSTKKSA
jgi:hypothetical protein